MLFSMMLILVFWLT